MGAQLATPQNDVKNFVSTPSVTARSLRAESSPKLDDTVIPDLVLRISSGFIRRMLLTG